MRHPSTSRLLAALALATASGGVLAAPGFGPALSENTTGLADALFLGAPDDSFAGLGSKSLTYTFGDDVVVNRPGAVDLNVYEVDFGGGEFQYLDVQVSADGLGFTSVKSSETALVRIAGDAGHAGVGFARSYDLGALGWARYVRLVGTGSGAAGGTNYFDLDAIGAHELVAQPVPEPAGAVLMMGGLAALALARRRTAR